jgi:hypothetical protein
MNARVTTILAAAIALLGVASLPLAEAGPFTNREARQQTRIGQGVESGQLTATETGRLEREQAKIEADREKAWSDGTLSKKEVGKLTREQNRASHRIYRLKHNDRTQPGTK